MKEYKEIHEKCSTLLLVCTHSLFTLGKHDHTTTEKTITPYPESAGECIRVVLMKLGFGRDRHQVSNQLDSLRGDRNKHTK